MIEKKASDLRIVGLTGNNAAGKGEAAKFLQSLGFKYFSLSDILRDEAERRSVAPSREILINLGRELREKEGSGVLARRIVQKLGDDLHVIDSIRHPEEVQILRQQQRTFFLIGIDAPIEVRLARAQARGRTENAETLEQFRQMENRERTNEPTGQQLDQTLELADVVVQNDGTLEQLNERLRKVLKEAGFI